MLPLGRLGFGVLASEIAALQTLKHSRLLGALGACWSRDGAVVLIARVRIWHAHMCTYPCNPFARLCLLNVMLFLPHTLHPWQDAMLTGTSLEELMLSPTPLDLEERVQVRVFMFLFTKYFTA